MAQKRSAPGASGGRGGGSAGGGAGGAKRGKFDHKPTGKSGSNAAPTGRHSAFENNKGKGKAPIHAAPRNNKKPERSAGKPEEVKKRKMPLTSSVVESPEDSEAEEDDEDMMDVDGEENDQDMETPQHGNAGGDAGGENKRLSKGEHLLPASSSRPLCSPILPPQLSALLCTPSNHIVPLSCPLTHFSKTIFSHFGKMLARPI